VISLKRLNIDASLKKAYPHDGQPKWEDSRAVSGKTVFQEQQLPNIMKRSGQLYKSTILLLSAIMILCEVLRLSRIGEIVEANSNWLGYFITFCPLAISIMTFIIAGFLFFYSGIKRVVIWLILPLLLAMFHSVFVKRFATSDMYIFIVAIGELPLGIRNIFSIFVCLHYFEKPTIPIVFYSLYSTYFIYKVVILVNDAGTQLGIEYYTGFIREFVFTVLYIFISILISHEQSKKKAAQSKMD
jgi:hypothetical protein